MIFYINRPDGLGSQLGMFAKGVINQKHNIRFISDMRRWQYFRNDSNFNFKKISSLFEFHPRAIVNPNEIDTIINENGCRYVSDTDFLVQEWKKMNPTKVVPWYGNVDPYLLMKVKTPPIKLDYEISDCIGVHARLGNGEENIKYHGRHTNPLSLRNRIVNENMFINEMKKLKNVLFYVCSDSKKFIDKCVSEFGNRVKFMDRIYMPTGCGAGHIKDVPKSKSRKFHKNIDSVDILYESYLDMYSLSRCSSLICNISMFSWLARNTIADSNKVILLKNKI